MKKLNVKYHTQRNNNLFPYSSCGTTCIAMLLEYLNGTFGRGYDKDDDAVFRALSSDAMVKKAQDLISAGETWISDYLQHRTVNGIETPYNKLNNLFSMLAAVGSHLTNVGFQFRVENLMFGEIMDYIDRGMPVIVSGKFTPAGHYVLIVGYNEDGFIVNDPYGNYNKGYKDDDGTGVIYKYAALSSLLMKGAKDKAICITVQKVR